MNFSLSSEQAALRDSIRRYCDKEYTFGQRLQAVRAGQLDRRRWLSFAEQGWLGMLLPAQLGGSDGTLIDSCLVMEELGRALVVEPILPCAVLAALAIDRGAEARHRDTLLPALIRGERLIALAHNEALSHGRMEYVAARATRLRSGQYSLTGDKQLALGGAGVRTFIVSARIDGDVLDRKGVLWFVVHADTSGVSIRNYRLLDGRGAADVCLRDVIVDEGAVLGEPDKMFRSVERATDAAIVNWCADALGAMEGALWATRDHLRNRRAYGAALSTFQALQHRMADMFAEVELSRSVLYAALAAVEGSSDDVRRSLISAAKVRIAQGGRFVCRNAIQLHGGMGMAEENRVGHYFKRLIVAATVFGSTDAHFHRFASCAKGER